MAAVTTNRLSEVIKDVALLPLAGLRDRQQPCGGDFAAATAVTETDLAPLHGGAQDALGYVIGRLDVLVFQKGE